MLSYLLNLLTVATIYANAAAALQLMVGQTGLLSVAQAVFLALGSYSAALVSTRLPGGSLLEIAITIALSAAISLLVSVPSIRLKDDYFAIMTFALQMIAVSVLVNWISVTRGPLGIGNIPPLSLGRYSLRSPISMLVAAILFFAFTLWTVGRVTRSRFGLALRALKSDELFAQSLGHNTLRMKISVIALCSVLTGLSGVLYAHFLSYIDPSSFGVMDSIFILSMVIIGGQRSPAAAAFGAFVLMAIPEGLRFLGISSALAANLRQVLYGSLLVVVVLLRPEGLFVRKGNPTVRLDVPDAPGV